MELGIFQLLSQPEGLSDREVIDQALWEVDFAEANGFDTVWVTEHHLSEYGLIGVPSVYAAGIAERTRRLRIGYGVAVMALNHPIRLAEEISWVDNLSQGRVWVGLGPGFSPYEFGAFGLSLDDRYARLEEGLSIMRGLLANEEFSYEGQFWKIPPVRLKPRPFTVPHPPFMMASASEESLRRSARLGLPPLIGFSPGEEVHERLATYRKVRVEMGSAAEDIERDIGRMGVLRRIHVADSDEQAMSDVLMPLHWYAATAVRVHRGVSAAQPGPPIAAFESGRPREAGLLPDGSPVPSLPLLSQEIISQSEGGMIAGTPDTVLRQLQSLADVGVGHVIAWMNFGNMPAAKVRRSMELMANEVLPRLRQSVPTLAQQAASARGDR